MLDTVKYTFPITKANVKAFLVDVEDVKSSAMQPKLTPRWVRDTISGRNFMVKPNREGTELEVEASLPKLLQGHNVCGINQMARLCMETTKLIYRNLGLNMSSQEKIRIETNGFKLGRVDITASFHVGNQESVKRVLAEIRQQLLARGNCVVVHEGPKGVETIYIGKNSRRATLKFYDKYAELFVNELPLNLSARAEILKYAEGLIRFEITLRAQELRRLGLDHSDRWSIATAYEQLQTRIERLAFYGKLKADLDGGEIEGITPRLRMMAGLCYDGANLRRHASPTTFRRLRDELLPHKIDIGRPPAFASTTISLRKIFSVNNMRFAYPKRLSAIGAIFGAKK